MQLDGWTWPGTAYTLVTPQPVKAGRPHALLRALFPAWHRGCLRCEPYRAAWPHLIHADRRRRRRGDGAGISRRTGTAA